MKKTILLICCFALLFGRLALAQSDREAPTMVTAAFMEKYPGIKVSDWDYDNDRASYKAKFKMDGKEMEAWFEDNGTWVKTKADLKREEVPAPVMTSLTTGEYKDWTFGDYMEVDTPEGKRYKVKAKYGSKEHYLKYNASGLLMEKTDAKAKDQKKKK